MFEHKISYEDRTNLPPSICLYGVFAGETVLYIGSAVGLRRRFRKHHKASEFNRLGATEIRWNEYGNQDGEKLNEDEKALIEKLNPQLNGNGGGRKPTRLNSPCETNRRKEIPKSKLHQQTYDLLWERIRESLGKTQTLDVIAVETGLTYSWLDYFSRNMEISPAVDRVECLYEYLKGKKIDV